MMKKHLDDIIEMLTNPVFWALIFVISLVSTTFSFIGAHLSKWLMP